MNNDEIINKAIEELKASNSHYMFYNQFTFLEGKKVGDDYYQKIKSLLIKSLPFEKYSDSSITFSKVGLEISSNHKDWYAYKKSLKPKTNYAEWVHILFTGILEVATIYQVITNNELKDEIQNLKNRIGDLEKINVEK